MAKRRSRLEILAERSGLPGELLGMCWLGLTLRGLKRYEALRRLEELLEDDRPPITEYRSASMTEPANWASATLPRSTGRSIRR